MIRALRVVIFAALSIVSTTSLSTAQEIVSLAGGSVHSLALERDGTVLTWGGNADGQLGNGTMSNSFCPVPVIGLGDVIAIGGGAYHSIALRRDGTVWAWGGNSSGQLGNGSFSDSLVAVAVVGLNSVRTIAVGAGNNSHSMALRTDGTVWSWGDNTQYQLGDGSTTTRSYAASVPGLSDITQIAVGAIHSLAVRADGSVWAWGDNQLGQIGNGTTADQPYPVQLGLPPMIQVAGGEFHSLGLSADGHVWSWGRNHHGQLGRTPMADAAFPPAPVAGLSDVVAISAGETVSAALKQDGTIWAWGLGGELGDGSVADSATPVQVTGLGTAVKVGAFYHHVLALAGDGGLWAWGFNSHGQLGNGTLNNSTVPVQVSFCPITVSIDIKPGSFPNSINLGSQGTVAVAIFSTPDFDATQVDPLTVSLASAPVKLRGKGTPLSAVQDVNADGRPDLVVHVDTTTLQLSEGDTVAVLKGKTTSGRFIQGLDSVRIVP